MSQTYGIEAPKDHTAQPLRAPVRYVIVIDSAGGAVSRLLLENRQQVEEFAGGAPEVAPMIQGLTPSKGALGSEWDAALQGHTRLERVAAEVYTLDV